MNEWIDVVKLTSTQCYQYITTQVLHFVLIRCETSVQIHLTAKTTNAMYPGEK